jgi:hypothetical protein
MSGWEIQYGRRVRLLATLAILTATTSVTKHTEKRNRQPVFLIEQELPVNRAKTLPSDTQCEDGPSRWAQLSKHASARAPSEALARPPLPG